jgi:uncharacterized membrane protein YkoI
LAFAKSVPPAFPFFFLYRPHLVRSQEFEKMRLQYETQIQSLTEEYLSKQSQKKSLVEPNGFLSKGIGQIPLEDIKTFSLAKEKIQ